MDIFGEVNRNIWNFFSDIMYQLIFRDFLTNDTFLFNLTTERQDYIEIRQRLAEL